MNKSPSALPCDAAALYVNNMDPEMSVFALMQTSIGKISGYWTKCLAKARCILTVLSVLALWPSAIQAQDQAYIQILTIKGLARTLDQLQTLTLSLPDVNGFALGGGWYAIAVGPYPRDEASLFLRGLTQRQAIPSDSYIEEVSRYGRRIWQAGKPLVKRPAATPVAPAPEPSTEMTQSNEQQKELRDVVQPGLVPLQEEEPTERDAQTPTSDDPEAEENFNALVEIIEKDEARATSVETSVLSVEQRREVQFALTWAGFYKSRIDGQFEERTVEAIRQWQNANGYEVTGVLLDDQREVLIKRHSSILSALAMTTVAQKDMGIQIELPLGAVTFDRYIGPFARYKPTGLVPGAQIFLISQSGSAEQYAQLFNAIKAANIVPPGGVTADTETAGYILMGRDERYDVYSHARIFNDQIKGFIVVWPRGDDQRRSRMMAEILSSFVPIPGVLTTTLDLETAVSIVEQEIAGISAERIPDGLVD